MGAAEIVAAVTTPLELDLGGGRSVLVSELRDLSDMLRVDLALLQDGVALPFSGPWIVGNPPAHVRVDGETVHDPAAAFDEMIRTSRFFNG